MGLTCMMVEIPKACEYYGFSMLPSELKSSKYPLMVSIPSSTGIGKVKLS